MKKKKKTTRFMIGSLLAASSILMVACTDEGTKEIVEEKKSETIVEKLQLTQDELSKAKLQQENRMVLLENFTNTALSSNAYYVSIDNLLDESEYAPLTATGEYEKDLQVALLNNSIDELNKILANQLTDKEVKLVEKLIDIKKLEIELTEILFESLGAGNFEKYTFTDELKTEYEDKRNLLVSFLLDSEDDIIESAYLYHYPEINKDDIEKHIEFTNLIEGLTDNKTTNDLKDNIDYLLFEVAVLLDVKELDKENILNLLNKIEVNQNEAKISDYYKENKFYKEFIDKYLEFNVQELKKNLENDNVVEIYKQAQIIYTTLFNNMEDERHSYTYLYINSYYYELKQAELDAKVKEESTKKEASKAAIDKVEDDKAENEEVKEVKVEDKKENE